jgi:hypothetical protein
MLFLLLVSSLYAAENRLSNVTVSGTNGPEDYQAASLDGLIGLNAEWAVTGSLFQSDSGKATFLDEELISQEGRLGADWQINATWNVAAEVISRRDPYEVSGRGGALATRAVVSDYWSAKRATTLKFKLEQIRYTQNLTLQGQNASIYIDRDISQRSGTLALDQEFTDWLSATLSHTLLNYGEDANQLAVTTARRRTSIGGQRAGYGLPDRVSEVELIVTPWDWSELRLGTSRSKIVDNDTETKSNSLGVSFFWKSWQFDLDGSRTDYGDTSGTEESTQDFVSAGIGYSW